MAKTRITRWEFKQYVRTGYREFMRQGAVLSLLVDAGNDIAAAAGEGVSVDAQDRSGARNTPRVAVFTDTTEAMVNEATDRTLTRALDAGRG